MLHLFRHNRPLVKMLYLKVSCRYMHPDKNWVSVFLVIFQNPIFRMGYPFLYNLNFLNIYFGTLWIINILNVFLLTHTLLSTSLTM